MKSAIKNKVAFPCLALPLKRVECRDVATLVFSEGCLDDRGAFQQCHVVLIAKYLSVFFFCELGATASVTWDSFITPR